jgi:hypothetical protein
MVVCSGIIIIDSSEENHIEICYVSKWFTPVHIKRYKESFRNVINKIVAPQVPEFR